MMSPSSSSSSFSSSTSFTHIRVIRSVHEWPLFPSRVVFLRHLGVHVCVCVCWFDCADKGVPPPTDAASPFPGMDAAGWDEWDGLPLSCCCSTGAQSPSWILPSLFTLLSPMWLLILPRPLGIFCPFLLFPRMHLPWGHLSFSLLSYQSDQAQIPPSPSPPRPPRPPIHGRRCWRKMRKISNVGEKLFFVWQTEIREGEREAAK